MEGSFMTMDVQDERAKRCRWSDVQDEWTKRCRIKDDQSYLQQGSPPGHVQQTGTTLKISAQSQQKTSCKIYDNLV